MKTSSLRTVILLGLALVVGTPSMAVAGEPIDPNLGDDVLGKAGGLRYAAESDGFDPGNNGYAFATPGCGGPRWHLIGAGAEAGGAVDQAFLAFGRPEDYNDEDDAGDDGWYTAGHGSGSAELTAYSICVKNTPLRYRIRNVADQPSDLRSNTLGCGGPRWHATTGGPSISPSDSWNHSSYPVDGGDKGSTPDDGWYGSAFDAVGGIGGFLVSVVCTRGRALRYLREPFDAISAGDGLSRRVACRADEHVVGGGVKVSGPQDEARLVASMPYDGGDDDEVPDDGWRSRVYNIAGADKKVTPFAVCLG